MSASYTGPERRWMTRSLHDWTYRSEQFNNTHAVKAARSADILYAMRNRLRNKHGEKGDALWDGYWLVKEERDRLRARVAEETARWFDDSAFARRPSGPVVCSFGDELAGKAPPTFGPAAEGRAS